MEEHAAFEELLDLATTFGAVGVPALFVLGAWAVWVDRAIRHMKRVGDKLLDMHEHPELTGFGTVGMEAVILDNTRALRELSHYVRWSTKQSTGTDPPPYLETA